MKVVLSIAGSDSSGGAGIQADIKTITAHGLYAATAVTALTAQNTTGVFGIVETSPEFVALQIRCVFEDIRPDAVKIGMVGSAETVRVIADELKGHDAKNIVLDPVMVATAGSSLIADEAVGALIEHLLPLATVVTPNIPEAEVLSNRKIGSAADMAEAAAVIAGKTTGAVLVKGGHAVGDADDLLLTADGREIWLRQRRIETSNTHGTGCTLSSAIACGLAMGLDVHRAVQAAKGFVSGALEHDPHLGKGNGPLDHMWRM